MRKLLPNQRITRKPDIFDCTPYDLLKCAQVLHSFLAERLEFASDPFNLTAASPKVNRDQKVGKDVAEWLLEMNCCWFVNRVVAVKRRYGLSLDSREAAAAQSRTESPIRLWCSSRPFAWLSRIDRFCLLQNSSWKHPGRKCHGGSAEMMRLFLPRRWLARVLLLALLSALLLAGIAVYFDTPSGEAMPEAKATLTSDAAVTVIHQRRIVFTPSAGNVASGYFLYPGGRVPPEAYAPLARGLAQAGSLAVIVPMPLNLAILNTDAATAGIAAFPRISTWIIAGHSLGGSMAARYAHQNPGKVDGLAMLAAYPEAHLDFSALDLSVAAVYGDRDGLATVEEVEGSFPQLPAGALKVLIKGGNHAQFGWYGEQEGDLAAQISRGEQQDLVIDALLSLKRTKTSQ